MSGSEQKITEDLSALDAAHSTSNSPRVQVCECQNIVETRMEFILLLSAFISCIPLVFKHIPSNNSTIIHFIIFEYGFHFLCNVFGERATTLIAFLAATTLAHTDVYITGSIGLFISCVATTSFAILVFSFLIMRKVKSPKGSPAISNLFITTSMILKSLLDNGIIPIDSSSDHSFLSDLQCAFFVESFILSILALWLHASGIPILSPTRRASYSLSQANRPSIAASVLYWASAILVIANVAITAARSSAETPTVVRVACGIFTVCALATVFKEPIDSDE